LVEKRQTCTRQYLHMSTHACLVSNLREKNNHLNNYKHCKKIT
jgi:hypothetical protein